MKLFVIAAAIAGLSSAAASAQPSAKNAPEAAPAMAAAELPADIKTYVTTHDSTPLNYVGKVAVGHGLDGDLIYQSIPSYPAYRWTNLNGQKVVVDKQSRHVVAIY